MRIKILTAIFLILISCAIAQAASKVNINAAGSEELQTLNGIGPAKAQAIIDYRETNGPFARIEDIGQVSGIPAGGATYNNIINFITVDDDAGEPVIAAADDEDDGPTPVAVSSHASPKELTTRAKVETLEVGAGRDRLTTVNTPLRFEAAVNLGAEAKPGSVTWSFGDGTAKRGLVAHHTYAWPGTYVVVVTAKRAAEEVSSRATVEVFTPALQVGAPANGAVTVTNLSKEEVNLGGWGLAAGEESFVFAPDTIILPGATINVASLVSGLPSLPEAITLNYPAGQIAARYDAAVAGLAAAVVNLTKPASQSAQPTTPSPAPPTAPPAVPAVQLAPPLGELAAIAPSAVQSSATGATVELAREAGWWRRLLNFFR